MYKGMFEQAIRALAAIDDALGIEADGCNEPERTLEAIAELKAQAARGEDLARAVMADNTSTDAGWISVDERLPSQFNQNGAMEGFDCLAYCGWVMSAVFTSEGFFTEDGTNPIYSVTHWMPLPTPPNAVANSAALQRSPMEAEGRNES